MFSVTPQERLALGVTALLVAAGAGARLLRSEAPPPEWSAPADTLVSESVSSLREEVEAETEERRIADTPLRAGERIDPNRADEVQLERLPRVGPALARRIVEHRTAHGPFRSLSDLDAVPGIGPSLLREIAPHVALPASAPGPAGVDGRIDLNRAGEAELEALPGIGPALARRIVEWREAHGPFRSLEELERVPGVGPALRERIAPRVRIGS